MRLLSALCAAVICLGASAKLTVMAKTWTIVERQEALMKEVNEGQKGKELTLKEAKKLRKELANLARKKAKMKAKSEETLTKENKLELEGDLNNISVEIKKLKLEKRAEAPAK